MNSTSPTIQPGFIGDEHPAFCLQFWPENPPRAHVVYLPPFTEEMNRCRAIVAEQARWFVDHGLSCSILDFYGSGESQGDLANATLPIWLQNVEDTIAELQQRAEAPVYLWGCRLGALVAMQYLQSRPDSCDKLLLWQPVSSGKAYVTQVLRQRTAGLVDRGEQAETTTELRQRLAAGETLDVGGYTLGGALLGALDELEIGALAQRPAAQVFWLEHSEDEAASLGARSERAVSHLRELGAEVTVQLFAGQPLWQLHKRDSCDELLATTRGLNL